MKNVQLAKFIQIACFGPHNFKIKEQKEKALANWKKNDFTITQNEALQHLGSRPGSWLVNILKGGFWSLQSIDSRRILVM